MLSPTLNIYVLKKTLFNIELPKIEGFTVLGVVSEVDL